MHALRALGCDVAQGYHYARPMLGAALTELLDRVGTIHDPEVPGRTADRGPCGA